jgi:hypothetical protein
MASFPKMLGLALGLLAAPAWSAGTAPAPDTATAMATAASHMVSERLLADMTGEPGRLSIRGTKALWVQVLLQGGMDGMPDLESDLRRSDLEGGLREQGFRVMDPAKRSLAMGLRPTLVVLVFYSPANPVTGAGAFYLVLANANQDCTPLGGDQVTMTTWAAVGDPIPATANSAADASAIRASARKCLKAFVAAARGVNAVGADTAP